VHKRAWEGKDEKSLAKSSANAHILSVEKGMGEH
jgi:hypothetical protein